MGDLAEAWRRRRILAILRRLRLWHKTLGVASGVGALLSTCSFGGTFSSSPQRLSLPITYHTSKMARLRDDAALKNARASRPILL